MKRRILSCILLFSMAAAAAEFYDSNTRLETEYFTLESDRLPESLSGLKIVHLSDLHTTRYGEANDTLFDMVASENPDIIALTGDIIDGSKNEEIIENEKSYVRELITALSDIAPVYFVPGNHEWVSPWVHELFALIEDCGGTVLRNEYVVITAPDDGGKIVLAGADDPNGPMDMIKPEEFVNNIREKEGDVYILMLYHRDTAIGMWAELGVDTVLCGHAHGGLIRLPFTDGLYAPGSGFFPDYTDGVYTEGNTVMFVSRGTGGVKLRFLNNPEVAVLTFRHID